MLAASLLTNRHAALDLTSWSSQPWLIRWSRALHAPPRGRDYAILLPVVVMLVDRVDRHGGAPIGDAELDESTARLWDFHHLPLLHCGAYTK